MLPSFGRWLGNVAVVTGANSGIGAAIAKKLTQEGIIVVGLDKSIEHIEETSKQLAEAKGQLHSVKANITREEEILQAFEWVKNTFGPLSILVNNAGTYFPSSIIKGKTEEWKTVLDVNLLAMCIASREAINVMRENNIDGHIINLCSITGHKVIPGLHMYPPSKFAVKAITETIRLELMAGKSKIKIGCISPGTVDTPMVRKNVESSPLSSNAFEYLKPEDIADAIAYVLSTPPNVQIEDMIVRPVGEPF